MDTPEQNSDTPVRLRINPEVKRNPFKPRVKTSPSTGIDLPVKPSPIRIGLVDDKLGLTRMQKLFVEYYLQGYSAYKAAKMAGYSEQLSTAASGQMLDNPKIIKAIAQRTEKSFKRLQITTDRIIEETAACAFANVMDYIDVNEDGKTFVVDLKRITRFNGIAIQELSHDSNGRPRLKLVDKKSSLELLARYSKFNMLAAKSEEKKEENKNLSISDWDELIQKRTAEGQSVTITQQINVRPAEQPTLPPATIEAQ